MAKKENLEETFGGAGAPEAGDTFVDVDFGDDVHEPVAMPEDEYELRILDFDVRTSQKTGGQFIMVRMEVVGEPYAKDFNHIMMLATENDEPKQANSRKFAIKSFVEAFDLPSRLSKEAVVGATGWAYLVQEDGGEYGIQNRVRKFLPRR